MPLQNRVDPFGDIHAVDDKGLFTGNRGIIHDPTTKTLLERRWTTKSWIICALAHPRGTKREPMGRNARGGGAGWTELFFLDEVTALAAGHRPCFYCRRDAATRYQHCFAAPNGEPPSAPAMDVVLHRERTVAKPILEKAEIAALPDGSMISVGRNPFAVKGGDVLAWNFWGYGAPERPPENAQLLTPPCSVAAMRWGYEVEWHTSAG